MGTVLQCAGLALVLALLVAIYLNVDSLPARVWAIAKREREEDAAAAQAALQAAAAPRVAALVAALAECHARSAAELRAQIETAELRARLAERQAKDGGTSLAIASEMVGELRCIVNDLQAACVRHLVSSDPGDEPEPDGAEPRASRTTLLGVTAGPGRRDEGAHP
jgi:Na+-transporting methylmalonyl-CoA/oxaloacetate decarboxylase gamma subunit